MDKCVCVICGSDMELYDCDFNFKGCYDNYWYCPKCKTIECFEKVRFGKSIFKEWSNSENS